MELFFKIVRKSIWTLIAILIVSYFIVPPVASMFVDRDFKSKFKTVMLMSDQPKPLELSSSEKILHRALNLDTYLSVLASSIWHMPSVIIDYALLPTKYPTIKKDSFGVYVDSSKASANEILDSLKDLNISSVAMRIYITDKYINSNEYKQNLNLAKKLKERGYSLMVVLAQLNETFSSSYESLLNKVVFDFSDYASFYQAGEAINRDKWGMINKERFANYIIAVYKSVSLNDPEAKVIGPAIIDFEWYYTIYYLNLAEDFIDIQGALLYVDRVGKPENSQYGFDTIKKVLFLKAIKPEKPLWITEVNWPIKGTGAYKPTSNKEAVSLEEYRDYMLRYLIETLSTGYVQRVYWWQLYAKGYGLIDNLTKRKYPAFNAYKKLVTLLSGATLMKKEHKNSQFKYTFKKGQTIFNLIWNVDGKTTQAPKYLRCKSFDEEIKSDVIAISSTPVVCGDKLSMEYISKVMR